MSMTESSCSGDVYWDCRASDLSLHEFPDALQLLHTLPTAQGGLMSPVSPMPPVSPPLPLMSPLVWPTKKGGSLDAWDISARETGHQCARDRFVAGHTHTPPPSKGSWNSPSRSRESSTSYSSCPQGEDTGSPYATHRRVHSGLPAQLSEWVASSSGTTREVGAGGAYFGGMCVGAGGGGCPIEGPTTAAGGGDPYTGSVLGDSTYKALFVNPHRVTEHEFLTLIEHSFSFDTAIFLGKCLAFQVCAASMIFNFVFSLELNDQSNFR